MTELSTADRDHSGRTLFDHLSGTRDLLAEWGNDEDICAAGLFHSIYGTQYYKVQSASLDRRRDVAAAIGDRAERMAFLFCVTDRPGFFEQADAEAPVLRDRVHETDVAVDRDTISALIEIEVANIVEQTDPAGLDPARTARARSMLDSGEGLMSEGARAALMALIDHADVR